jgi:hypothetical protein
MSNIWEEILKNKEELLLKVIEILEGKEAKAAINLDGVEFKVGKSKVELAGRVEFTFKPSTKK